MPKHRQKLKIDERPSLEIGGTPLQATASPAPPAVPVPQPPVLTSPLTTALYESAQTPAALINASWTYGGNSALVSSYLVQYSTSSSFTAATTSGVTANATDLSVSIYPLPCNVLFYVRVAARVGAQSLQSAWSNVESITTAVDTTAPSPVTSLAGSFVGTGDLLLTWTNPTSANFHWADVRIYASNGGALLRQVQSTTGRFLYTVAMNLADTGGAGDPSLYIDVRAQSWGAIYSTSVNLSPTKSVPTTPTGFTSSWASDTGTAGADCAIVWNVAADAARYNLSIDSVIRTVAGAGGTSPGRYTYSLIQNSIEHSNTPDPVLSLSLVAVDGLGQSSTAATATATNVAPTAPTVTLTGGAMSLLTCRVTSSPVADFAAYEYVFKRDGTTIRTQETASAVQSYEAGGAGDQGVHSWTCVVRQKDAFAQYSSTTTSGAVSLDTLTIEYLRSGAFYSDSDSNSFVPPSSGTLAVLKDNVFSGGVSYSA